MLPSCPVTLPGVCGELYTVKIPLLWLKQWTAPQDWPDKKRTSSASSGVQWIFVMHVSCNDFSFLSPTRPRLWTTLANHVFIIGWKITFFSVFHPALLLYGQFIWKWYFTEEDQRFQSLEALQLLSILSYQTLWKVLSSRSLSRPQRARGTAATSLTLPCSTQVLTNDSNKVKLSLHALKAKLFGPIQVFMDFAFVSWSRFKYL